jgi:hypothetical protein
MDGQGGGTDETPPGEGPPPTPPLIPEGGAPDSNDGKGKPPSQNGGGRENFDRDLVKWTRWVAFLTGCLFIAALLQFGAALLQWSSMSQQVTLATDALHENRGAIEAATRQADQALLANAGAQSIAAGQRRGTDKALGIAGGQLATTQDTAKRQLRAYVSFGLPSGTQERSGDVYIYITLINTGETPTVGLQVATDFQFSTDARSDPWNNKILVPKPGAMTLAPRVPQSIPVYQMTLADQRQHINHHIYVFGRATYRDELSPKRRRITEFCDEIRLGPGTDMHLEDTACDEPARNCTDEQCTKG